MPIDKSVNPAPSLGIIALEDEPVDIEIEIDEDGGATIEIGSDEAEEVDFYANLALAPHFHTYAL